MTDLIAETKVFFESYARRSSDALLDPPREDLEGMVDSFADYFVGSSPAGVRGGANDAELRAMIPRGFEAYRKMGGKRMAVTGVDVTVLDDLHVMATIGWVFDYVRPGDGKSGSVAFTNRYFLTYASGAPKVFAYITPDEQAAMREHGLA